MLAHLLEQRRLQRLGGDGGGVEGRRMAAGLGLGARVDGRFPPGCAKTGEHCVVDVVLNISIK